MTYFLNRLPIIVFVISTTIPKKKVARLSRFAQTDNSTFITRMSNDIVKITDRYSRLLNHWVDFVTINIKEKISNISTLIPLIFTASKAKENKFLATIKNQKLLAMNKKLNSTRSSKISLTLINIIKAITPVSNDNIIARKATAKNIIGGL